MPYLHLPDTDAPATLRACYYRRTLHKGYAWHAVELANGDVLILRRPRPPPLRRIAGAAAVAFRQLLSSAQGADRRTADQRRAERLCAVEMEGILT